MGHCCRGAVRAKLLGILYTYYQRDYYDNVNTSNTSGQKSAVVSLMQAAGDGIFEFLMNNIVPFINVKTLLPMIYGRDDNILSYKYIQVASLDKQVVAMMSAFPSEQRTLSPLLKEHVPADRLDHLMPFLNQSMIIAYISIC